MQKLCRIAQSQMNDCAVTGIVKSLFFKQIIFTRLFGRSSLFDFEFLLPSSRGSDMPCKLVTTIEGRGVEVREG